MIKNLSVFQAVFYGTLIVIAGIGLYVFATYTSKGGANEIGSVTIWGTLPSEQMRGALIEGAKLDDALENVTYVEKEPATLAIDLSAAIATGRAPDLIIASQEQLFSLEPFSTVIPLSTLSARDFSDAFTQGGAVYASGDGKGYWGIPLLIDPLMLFYNRSLLSSSGVVAPPSTWEALTGLVPTVSTYTATKQITRGLIALGTYDNVHNARGILSALFLQTSVPVSVTSVGGDVRPSLGRSSTATSVGAPGEAVVRFYTQFADPGKVSYTWNASLLGSQQMFGQGDLALYLGYASEARFFKEFSPNLAFDVAPVPQPATAVGKTTYGLIYAGIVPRGAKNASGGYKAAVILAGTKEQAVLASATGMAPATLAALAAPTVADPVASVAATSALYARGWISPAPASVDQIFSAMISDVVTGRSDINAALVTAERSLGAALER